MHPSKKAAWRSAVLALAIALLLAAVALFVIFRLLLPKLQQPEETGEPQFVIAAWEGQVAVFEGGSPYPKQVFDVYVRALPAEQQAALQAGIPAETEEELSVLLEDYTS